MNSKILLLKELNDLIVSTLKSLNELDDENVEKSFGPIDETNFKLVKNDLTIVKGKSQFISLEKELKEHETQLEDVDLAIKLVRDSWRLSPAFLEKGLSDLRNTDIMMKKQAIVFRTIGQAYYLTRKNNYSYDYHKKSIECSEKLKDDEMAGHSYINIGNASWSLGYTIESIKHYRTAENLLKNSKDENAKLRILSGLGNSYCSLKMYDKSSEYHMKRYELSKKIYDKARSALGLATTYRLSKKFEEAHEKALFCIQNGDSTTQFYGYQESALLYLMQNDLYNAGASLDGCLKLEKDMLDSEMAQESRIGVVGGRMFRVYELKVLIEVMKGNKEYALELLDKIRSKELLNNLYQRKEIENNDPMTFIEMRELAREENTHFWIIAPIHIPITLVANVIKYIIWVIPPESDKEITCKIMEKNYGQFYDTCVDLDVTNTRLYKGYSDFSKKSDSLTRGNSDISITRNDSTLSDRRQFPRTRSDSIDLIRRDSEGSISRTESGLRDRANSFVSVHSDMSDSFAYSDSFSAEDIAAEPTYESDEQLFQFELLSILEPALPEIAEEGEEIANQLVIIVTGILATYPLAHMVNKEGQNVLLGYAITTSPSLKLYSTFRHRYHERMKIQNGEITVMVLNPESDLDNTTIEVGSLEEVFGEDKSSSKSKFSVQLLDQQIGNDEVIDQLRNLCVMGIFHVCSHSYAESSNTLTTWDITNPKSLIKLANNQILEAMDVMKIIVLAYLAVLNSCFSVKGSPTNNEGTIAWPYSCFIAGFLSVLGTTSPVNDEFAAQFIPEFYRSSIKTGNLAQGLRNTKIKFKHEKQSEYYTLIGYNRFF